MRSITLSSIAETLKLYYLRLKCAVCYNESALLSLNRYPISPGFTKLERPEPHNLNEAR